MAVFTERTPNPNAVKFKSDKPIFSGEDSFSAMLGEKSEFPILNEILALDNVINVLGYQDFITVNKTDLVEWDELISKVIAIMETHGY